MSMVFTGSSISPKRVRMRMLRVLVLKAQAMPEDMRTSRFSLLVKPLYRLVSTR